MTNSTHQATFARCPRLPDFRPLFVKYRKQARGTKKPLARRHRGHEIYSIGDDRQRYPQYWSDPDLQAAHAAAPWFASFNDHEIDNNWAGDID